MTEPKKYDTSNNWYCPDCKRFHDPSFYCMAQLVKIIPPAYDVPKEEKPSK